MKGVIVSYFPNERGTGHGFVKQLADPNNSHSATGAGYFYHLDDSPHLDQITHIGMVVEFDLITASDYRQRAISLTRVG